MLTIKPELWTKNGGEKFVMLSLRDFEKVQDALEDAGLARLLRQAKARDTGGPGASLADMKRLLGMPGGKAKRPATR
jgi:hypothetical protein